MKIDIPVSNYESIKVIPDGRCPHPRYTIRNKTDAMFSTRFKDTISICNDSGELRFLGREVKP